MSSDPFLPVRNRRKWLVRCGLAAAAALLGAGALYVLTNFAPADHDFYPKCLSYRITSIHCPGCGTTRALHALLNLRFEQAFAYNAVGVALLPFGLFFLIRYLWHRAWGTAPGRLPGFVWGPKIVAIVLILFWILRNIPVYPFELLAPHELTP